MYMYLDGKLDDEGRVNILEELVHVRLATAGVRLVVFVVLHAAATTEVASLLDTTLVECEHCEEEGALEGERGCDANCAVDAERAQRRQNLKQEEAC